MVKLFEDQFDLYMYNKPQCGPEVKNVEKSVSIRSFTWENASKVSVQVITYGATVTFMKIPDKNGVPKDVVTGFKNLAGFRKSDNPYFGATVGRVANRIGNGQFKLLDQIIQVNKNLGPHQLHGGFVGFDKITITNAITFKFFSAKMSFVTLKVADFGFVTSSAKEKTPIKLFTWSKNEVSIGVMTYGATIVSIKIPGKDGKLADIVTGFSTVEGYLNPLNRFFGATVGRFANRINRGKVQIKDEKFSLSVNRGDHHLHGGFKGFDKVVWEHFIDGNKVIMSYHSADLEEGYPGDLVVHATFELKDTNEFVIEYKATTTKPTYVNMTNHSYFNLAGHNAGPDELYKHTICINADHTTEVDKDSIPTGKLLPVAGTIFDLQIPKILGEVINKVPNSPGYDHNFCITKGPEQGNTFVARVIHPESGRVMEIYSNQPGVQFYTSNFLPENPATYKGDKSKLQTLTGKDGDYYKHGALCLETQNWPDAPNHENFPPSILLPGQTYYHYVAYKFSVKN